MNRIFLDNKGQNIGFMSRVPSPNSNIRGHNKLNTISVGGVEIDSIRSKEGIIYNNGTCTG